MTDKLKPFGYVLKTGHGNSFRETLDGVAPELRHLWVAVDRRTEPAGSAEPSNERLAKMLVAVANDDSIPKLDDEEIRAICQSRGWSLNDTPTLRELAHVFYAEGCAAQRRTQSTHQPESNKAGESDLSDAEIVKAVHAVGGTGRVSLTFTNNDGEEKPTLIVKDLIRALLAAKGWE